MPDGRVLRIDPDQECVYIVRRGRTYRAPLAEVESAARVASARVRFGLRRSNGVESAESVVLRRGNRTNRRQRRFGDLTGAAKPGAKIGTTAHSLFGIDVTTQPLRVVEAWLEAMHDESYEQATSLYLPEATLTGRDGSISGRKRIRAFLEDSGWQVDPDHAILHCLDRYVSIETPDDADSETSFLVRNGQIVSHWFGVTPERDTVAEGSDASIEVIDLSGISQRSLAYAEDRIRHLVEHVPETVTGARVKLSVAANPTVLLPASAEATLDLDGEFLRVKSAATTLGEAVDQVVTKFASKIEHRRDRERRNPVGLPPVAGGWRHGNLRSEALPYFDRPAETREIVRHKTFAPGEMTVEEAAWDADLMDLDFFLFVELSTGHDCLLERTEDSYVVHGLGDDADLAGPGHGSFDVDEKAPPVQKLSTALEILDQTAAPFHFFTNVATGRGNVIYRRRDGHYGLVTPDVTD